MAMPITIIRKIFQIVMKIISWYLLTGLGGIPFIWPLRPSPSSLFLWRKKNSSPIVFLAGGFVCVELFRLTVKIQGQKLLSTPLICWKRATVPWLCSQVGAGIHKMLKVVSPSLLKWLRSVSCQWLTLDQEIWTVWQLVSALIWTLDIQLIFQISKKWMTKG